MGTTSGRAMFHSARHCDYTWPTCLQRPGLELAPLLRHIAIYRGKEADAICSPGSDVVVFPQHQAGCARRWQKTAQAAHAYGRKLDEARCWVSRCPALHSI